MAFFDATQSAIRGEALVLRSFCHFILAQVFCEPYAGPDLSKNKTRRIPHITRPEVTRETPLMTAAPL